MNRAIVKVRIGGTGLQEAHGVTSLHSTIGAGVDDDEIRTGNGIILDPNSLTISQNLVETLGAIGGCAVRESQRDSVPKPRVARNELHWVMV